MVAPTSTLLKANTAIFTQAWKLTLLRLGPFTTFMTRVVSFVHPPVAKPDMQPLQMPFAKNLHTAMEAQRLFLTRRERSFRVLTPVVQSGMSLRLVSLLHVY